MNLPRILLLVDIPNWAFDISAREIRKELSDCFDFDIQYVHQEPKLEASRYDLIHVFSWAEQYHKQFGFLPERVLREVASRRWIDKDFPLYCPNTETVVERFLSDCGTMVTPSLEILHILEPHNPRVFHGPNGFSEHIRTAAPKARSGDMTIGWAGAPQRLKGLDDILLPACADSYDLQIASAILPQDMPAFYAKLDVLCVASTHECEPLTVIESLAMGCFPVCTRVGVVPELIEHKNNGYIVELRTPEAFSEAFSWCEANLQTIRDTALERAEKCRAIRNWRTCAQAWKAVYLDAIEYANNNPSPPDFKYPPVFIPQPQSKKHNRWDRRLERWLRHRIRALFGKSKEAL